MLTPKDLAQLVGIISRHVPTPVLADAVRDYHLIKDFDALQKTVDQRPRKGKRQLVIRIVKAYDEIGRAHLLAHALYRRQWRDEVFAAQIGKFCEEDDANDAALQASIALRANTLHLKGLREFLNDNEAKVCVVVAVQENPRDVLRGTGFLVGPDLVLTTFHTLRNHINGRIAIAPSPGPLYAIFDHYDGDPINHPVQLQHGATKVNFHPTDWLVECSETMKGDGTFHPPSQAQLDALRSQLDFALVRLEKSIGLHSRRRYGGPRRAWIDINKLNAQLQPQDRIIIPQHPNGVSQRIDFGRFSEWDPSQTRIRYDTETQNGTSGAPCFDQNFRWVGMHNAAFKPKNVMIANQAIGAERIVSKLGPAVAPPPPAARAERIWSLSSDPSAPRVIFARIALLDWIDRASQNDPVMRSDRIYAAISPRDDTGKPLHGAGKTFSAEVLRISKRESGEPVVVLGGREQFPVSVADFIRALGDQLAIPEALLNTMPARPSDSLPPNSTDGDKLKKWASEDIPRWFDGVLANHRAQKIDRRPEMKDLVDYLRKGGKPVPPEVQAIADSDVEVLETRNRWSIAWIALDRLLETTISGELWDVIAGLTGGNFSESSMPKELRRLRWLFLGHVPDFLASGDATQEKLDAMQIKPDTIVTSVASLARSFSRDLTPLEEALFTELIAAFLEKPEAKKAVEDPTRRLDQFQATFGELQATFSNMLKLAQ